MEWHACPHPGPLEPPWEVRGLQNNRRVLLEGNLPGSVNGCFFKIPFLLPCISFVSFLSPVYLPLSERTPQSASDFSVPVRIRDWASCQAQCSGEGRKNRDLFEPSNSVCLRFSFNRKSMIAWSKQKTEVMMPLCTLGSGA